MKLKFKTLFLFSFLLLFLAVPVYAVINSSTFLVKAQKFVDNKCKGTPDSQTSLLCYLFYKTGELQEQLNSANQNITSLNTLVSSQSGRISDLEGRINSLEHPSSSPSPTPSPSPNVIVFAQDRPASFTTDFIAIPHGYMSMTFHVTTTGTLYGWSPIANVNSFVNEQTRVLCPNNICPDVTIPIISGFYKFGTGTSSGNITAIATLNADPNSSTQTLGYGVPLPFTSGPLQTNPGYLISVFVGQRDPQRMNGISLQRNENGVFVEKEHVSCDGGAICPVNNLPLLGGEYRVVVEGSGVDALVSVFIRPQ